MARYIDADKVHEEIEAIQISLESNDDKVWYRNKPYYKGLAMSRRIINDTPTADVAPKSEVAREIFEEIEEMLNLLKIYNPYDSMLNVVGQNLVELKKKYTEGKE